MPPSPPLLSLPSPLLPPCARDEEAFFVAEGNLLFPSMACLRLVVRVVCLIRSCVQCSGSPACHFFSATRPARFAVLAGALRRLTWMC